MYNLEQLETLVLNLLDCILTEKLLKQKCEAFFVSVSFMALIEPQMAAIDRVIPRSDSLDSEFTFFETIYLVLILLSRISLF